MRLRRVVAALISFIIPATMVIAGPFAPQAASAQPHTRLVACRSMHSSADYVAAPILLGGCDRPGLRVPLVGLTGGSGTTYATGNPEPTTWATGKKTNYDVSTRTFAPSRCPASAPMEVDVVGVVVTVSGPYTKKFLGARVAFDTCLTNLFVTIELVPGTKFTIG